MIKTFTLTASPRAKILSKTLKSFSNNLVGISLSDCTIYANIDPFEGYDKEILKVVDVLNSHFGNVIYRIPESPNFSEALKYVWSQPSDELIFHLEDDWKLEKQINLDKIESYFYRYDDLMQVRLHWKRCLSLSLKNPRYGLSPCIVRKTLYQIVASELLPNKNPEWQIRKRGKRWGVPEPSTKSIFIFPKVSCIKDIGARWKINRKIHNQKCWKHDPKFVKWVSEEEKQILLKQYKKNMKLKMKRQEKERKDVK